jgi:hypothetical protein
MQFKRLFGRETPEQHGPRVVNGGEVELGAPWGPTAPHVREVRHVTARPADAGNSPAGERGLLSGGLLFLVSLVLLATMIGAGYVVYGHQRLFALQNSDHDALAARIVGGLPDVGWICMAALAVVAALRGRSSLRARTGVVIFFSISMGAQLMYAPRTPAGLLVAVIAPVTLAWILETFLVELRHFMLRRLGMDAPEELPILSMVARLIWRTATAPFRVTFGAVLWLIRLCLDWDGTKAGVREWVLDVAPIAPGRTGASLRAAAAEQTAAALREQGAQELDEIREQHARQLSEIQQQHAAELGRLAGDRVRLEHANDRLTTKFGMLADRSTSRARLIAAYEALRVDDDPRYGDRAAVAEVARELCAEAGLASEGTARAYLAEHLNEIGEAQMRFRSSDLSETGAMIGANGVNGS